MDTADHQPPDAPHPPPGTDSADSRPDAARPYVFRWRQANGSITVLNCLARNPEEAEHSARRAGWPGHDGTRLGRFRGWLRHAVLSDGPPLPLPPDANAPIPPPERLGTAPAGNDTSKA